MSTATQSTSQSNQQEANSPSSQATDRSVGEAVGRRGSAAAEHLVTTPAKDIFSRLQQYAREKPDIAVCWCFALGVVVGWKLRP